ncbi:MAG: GNAT family N-acetyltransferase [Candidatus Atribacteria bacterium]|nr:GNAT family N-acetyltransferase [Candidatus Atribacteria bacterium]
MRKILEVLENSRIIHNNQVREVQLIEARELKKNKQELLEFINFAWEIYKNDPHWVPPLKNDLLSSFLNTGNNSNGKINCGPHAFFMAWENDTPLGRVLVGINQEKNIRIRDNVGYFGYLEVVNSQPALEAIMDKALEWLKGYGIDCIVGPLCPDDDVEGRGVLIKGFDSPPILMNPYNPPYYQTLLKNAGFTKDMDFYAYYSNELGKLKGKIERLADYAMKKFNFTVEKVNFKKLDAEIKDACQIFEKIIKAGNEVDNGFEYSNPPTFESFFEEMKKYLPFLDKDLIYIARSEGKPIGFVLAIPDYNQVLKKINGKLFPFGLFKYLWYKQKINGIRGFAQFVIPEFQNKAVNGAMFKHIIEVSEKKGYDYFEASTICEHNLPSRRTFENEGLSPYKIYRVYRKGNRKSN